MKFQSRFLILAMVVLIASGPLFGQSKWGHISGDFGFNGMYYIPDSTIGAKEVKEKVRANTWLNLNYTNGGFTAGVRYEFYSYPLIDFEDIGYKGQGLTNYFLDYKNDFIQVTAGTFYEQFGNGFTLRAYEDRQLGIDNSLLGARIKVTPYKGITIKGVWGIERKNFDFEYTKRKDYVRGLDAELSFGDMLPKLSEKGFTLAVGGSFVSKFEKSEKDMFISYPDIPNMPDNILYADKIPQNIATWAARINFGYKGFRLESEFAHKNNDPNNTNGYIYKTGNSFLVTASYSMKGFGVEASFIRSDNMDFRSQRDISASTPLLGINYIPAVNRQYTYALLGNYTYASQPNGQIGVQAQVNYKIPKGTKLGGKYGIDITVNYARFHDVEQQMVPDALELNNMTGTDGYTSRFFKFGENLLYQDFGIDFSHRFNNKSWKLDLAYNFITYNLTILQGHASPLFRGHNVMGKVTYKINNKHALKLEIDHLYAKEDDGSWLYGLLEYSIAPHWFISVADQWNYGNEDKMHRTHYYNIAAAYVIKTTRISLNFGKTKEGILCIGGVCRSVPASYGVGLSVTTSF